MVGDGMMTVEEARQFLRVSRSTMYELMDSGQIAYVRFGRNRRVPRRGLIEFATRGLVAG
jgi:excisionase family DNA binding protein